MNKNTFASALARGLRLLLAAALLAGLALNAGPARVAQAATFAVTRFDDPLPDGCNVGDCSLREAIRAANASPGQDIISLQAGTYALTIEGADEDAARTGDLDITDDLTIEGEGWTHTSIVSGVLDRVFDIQADVVVAIDAVGINNGKAGNGNGGGIRNLGTLHVFDSRIGGNGATDGGGIYNSGGLTILNTTISGNEAGANGGGIASESGGVTLFHSTLSTNSANGEGGGIFNAGGSNLRVNDSTIAGNEARTVGLRIGRGGGLASRGPFGVTDSAIFGNRATSWGGGILFWARGTASIENSTLYQNSAGHGGAIKLEGNSETVVNFQNVTITGNSATGSGGGIASLFLNSARLKNTLLALNTAAEGPNCTNTLLSRGHNLFGNMSGCFDIRRDPGAGPDIVCPDSAQVLDPKIVCPAGFPGLGAFTDDGTPGRGHIPLLPGSPAIDGADNVDCGPRSTDQRGVSRPFDGDGDRLAVCDIGAYEAPPAIMEDFANAAHPRGRLNANWDGRKSRLDYRVVNDQLDVEGGGPIYWLNDSFGPEQQAFITLAQVDPQGQYHGLLLKMQGTSWRQGVISVYYDAAAGEIRVENFVPGEGWRPVAIGEPLLIQLRDGDQLGAQARASGYVDVYINGVWQREGLAHPFFRDKGGRVGLWFVVAADAVLDDFSGATVVR